MSRLSSPSPPVSISTSPSSSKHHSTNSPSLINFIDDSGEGCVVSSSGEIAVNNVDDDEQLLTTSPTVTSMANNDDDDYGKKQEMSIGYEDSCDLVADQAPTTGVGQTKSKYSTLPASQKRSKVSSEKKSLSTKTKRRPGHHSESNVQQSIEKKTSNASSQSQQRRYSSALFSRLMSFFTFSRKKKFKINKDLNENSSGKEKVNLRGRRTHSSLPFFRQKSNNKNSAQRTKDDSDLKSTTPENPGENSSTSTEQPSVFIRFIRTFSYIYKKNPNLSPSRNQKLKRSTSLNSASPRKSKEIRRPQPKRNTNQPLSKKSRRDSDNFSAGSSPSRYSEPVLARAITSPIKSPKKQFSNIPNGDIGGDGLMSSESSQERSKSPEKVNGEFVHPLAIDQLDNFIPPSSSSKAPLIEPIVNGGDLIDLKNIKNGEHHEKFPQKHLVSSGNEIPAVCGIQNHGNTCFINSIIQCLSNTNPFAEYLVMDFYRDDLQQNKQMSPSKRSQTRGELTEHLAVLLKSLWSCMYSSEISLRFKRICSKYAQQYSGYEQHDAQEFLLWLLDKTHEELNVSNGKSRHKSFVSMLKSAPSSSGRHKRLTNEKSDETQAAEFLAKCQTSNTNSIIYDLFQGQLRSMIVCSNCRYCSKTFDPYMCISVPVPVQLQFTIFVQAIFQGNRPTIMHGKSIEAAATLRELRDTISRMIRVPERRLLLLRSDDLVEFANDTQMIHDVFEDCETIYALETPELPQSDGQMNSCQMMTIAWLNSVIVDNHSRKFGPLFTTVVNREINYKKLQNEILRTMTPYVNAVDTVDLKKISDQITLRLRVVNGLSGKEYLPTDVDLPLFGDTAECALSKTEDRRQYRGPYHLKLIVEWDQKTRTSVLVNDEQFATISSLNGSFVDDSVKRAKECKMNNRTTLQDCLDMYFRDESLSMENALLCSSCSSRQQVDKHLSIWSLPDILIIHLKRFRCISNQHRVKVNSMIEYPQNGLDLIKYVQRKPLDVNGDLVYNSHNHQQNSNSTKVSSSSPSSKLTYKKLAEQQNCGLLEETTYNLYAVCCHHGTMQSGHYTAYCKNSVDNCWYLFDDTKVLPIRMEDAVLTPDAYILFYQKSYVSTAYSSSSSSRISSGMSSMVNHQNHHHYSVNHDHWAFRMPSFISYYNNNPNSTTIKSSTLPIRKPSNKLNNSSPSYHHQTNNYSMKESSSNHHPQYSGHHSYQSSSSYHYSSHHQKNNNGSSTMKTSSINHKYLHDNDDVYHRQHHHQDEPTFYHSSTSTNNNMAAINTFPRNKSKYSY